MASKFEDRLIAAATIITDEAMCPPRFDTAILPRREQIAIRVRMRCEAEGFSPMIITAAEAAARMYTDA